MPELHLIAHNIRSRENVGSLFRTADSLGVSKLWITGYTPAPPDAKLSKVALGAEEHVSYEQVIDLQGVIQRLRVDGYKIYALELTSDAIELAQFNPPLKIALLLGTETTGIPPSLIAQCDGAIMMTQKGMKESMNVAVAAGIAAWKILCG